MLRVDLLSPSGEWVRGIDYYMGTSGAMSAARRESSKWRRAARVVYPFSDPEQVLCVVEPEPPKAKKLKETVDLQDAINQIFKGGT